jgi:acetylornithine deacetylase/succinyl-diaminopimelate desuccinylase-like protein
MHFFERTMMPVFAIGICVVSACTVTEPTAHVDAGEYVVASRYSQEISDLAAREMVKRALDHIVAIEPRSLADLIELTEIPAPPFAEELRAARFAELLEEAGLTDVTVDDVGNVIGRRPGKSGERTIAYTAHLDTVFPAGTDVTVRVEGDTYYAPGIGDNTRGLVVVLGVLRAGGPRIDTMIAVDGGNASRLVYGGVGSHRYRVTYSGPGGHSWGAFGTASPHHALGRAIAMFAEDAPTVTARGEKTSFNVGRIGGGTSVNSIAFESWMEVDMRSGDQGKLDEIDAVFQSAVQRGLAAENASRTEGPGLSVDVVRIGTRPAVRGDSQSPLVQRAVAAMRAFDVEPELEISSTDANHPISLGIPAITMSRGGNSADSHSLAESWQDKDGHVAVQIGLLTVLAEAGVAH